MYLVDVLCYLADIDELTNNSSYNEIITYSKSSELLKVIDE